MTVSSSTNKVQYNGNGSTTVFAYTFKIFDQDDLTVIIRSATGTETTKTITTHYTVSGVGADGGGNVTMLTAPASGETITILREQPLTQGLDLVPNDPFPANSIEDALDKLTFMVQSHSEELDRAIKASRTNTITSTEFTVSAANRANKVFAFDGSGELSVTQELGTYTGNWAASTSYAQRDIIKDTSNNNIYICITAHTSSGSQPISSNADSAKWGLLVDAASATTSATNAAASASAAATSATNAANSATAAAASESAAATSASNASTSETNAASSATNAAASATAAAASETAAGTSETNAAASETAAAASASAASTSASNAATSETNAASSASTASTAATTATTQATAAAASATAAAASESAAATSASSASASADAALAALDSFDDRYLGQKASDPTVDNDGNPLVAGALYFNTTDDVMKVYEGSVWVAAYASLSGALLVANNLSDVANAASSRTNLGLGTGDSPTFAGATITGNVSVDGGTIKLDGNYPAGSNNVALGDAALNASITGGNNVAIGWSAGANLTSGGQNVAIGQYAANVSTTSSANTAVGYQSQRYNTTGGNNTSVGYYSLRDNTTGQFNTALGQSALQSNTTANNNTTVGYQAGYSNTTGTRLAALGYQALYANTTGNYNTAVGYAALDANTTASYNTALGHFALSSLVGGGATLNTAIGSDAMANTTTGTNNVAVGSSALASNTTASNNTAVGYQAGYNSTGQRNAFFGSEAGQSNTTGESNTYIGRQAGQLMTTGNNNTILGRYNGNQGGLDIRTSSNNIVLSDGDGNPRVYIPSSGSMAVGTTAFDTSNTTGITQQLYSNGAYITIGKTSSAGNGEGYLNFNRNGSTIGSISQASTSSVSYNTTSDYRLKENVVNLEGATARLVQLQPKRFEWINDTDGVVWDGFLAHEVQSVVPEAITGTKDAVDADGNPVYQGIDQSKLVPLLVATIKELEARITALEAN